MSFSLSLLVQWFGFGSFTTAAWVWFPLREWLAFGETLGISQKLGTTAEKVILFWVSDLRTVAISRTLCCSTNIPFKGQQVKISSLREIYFLSSTCQSALLSKRWRKPKENVQSFEQDLNQRPKDYSNFTYSPPLYQLSYQRVKNLVKRHPLDGQRFGRSICSL